MNRMSLDMRVDPPNVQADLRTRIGMSGRCEIQVRDAHSGALKRAIFTKNLIVNDGLAFLIDRAKGDTFLIANFFAVGGYSPSSPAPTEQLLGGEVFRTQIATSRRIGSNQWQVKGFVASGQANGNNLSEFGIFASPNPNEGPMICRLVHLAIPKTTAVTVTYIWTGTLTAL